MTRGYSELYQRIQQEIPIEEMTRENIKKFINADRFPERNKLVEEFIISASYSLGEKFAREKNIVIKQGTIAKTEKWGKRGNFLVIREKGRFKAWKKI